MHAQRAYVLRYINAHRLTDYLVMSLVFPKLDLAIIPHVSVGYNPVLDRVDMQRWHVDSSMFRNIKSDFVYRTRLGHYDIRRVKNKTELISSSTFIGHKNMVLETASFNY